MSPKIARRPVISLTAAAAVLLVAACDNPAGVALQPTTTALDLVSTPPAVARELLVVCKDGPAGTYSFEATSTKIFQGTSGATVLYNDTDADGVVTFTVDAGSCLEIALKGGPNDSDIAWVTVSELIAPGTEFVSSTLSQLSPTGTTVTVGGNSPVAAINGRHGANIVFLNREAPVGGGEGCTPGYWKQSHHFDSWSAPYTPDMAFSAVFEDAFPGMTLLDVLQQGGGGLNALGRHVVAALLNGASTSVSYDLSDLQVISQFNAVFPGTKNDYEALKNTLGGYNEQGCPLN